MNGIHNVKFFNYDIELIKSFISEYEKASSASSSSFTSYDPSEKEEFARCNKNSSLQFIVAIPNHEIKYLAENKDNYINKFIDDVIEPYHTYIQYVALGNEPFNPYPADNNQTVSRIANQLTTAYFNLIDGLNKINYKEDQRKKAIGQHVEGQIIPIVIPFSMEILEYSFPPSNASFYRPIINEMKDIFLDMNKRSTPFFFNIYPYYSMLSSNNGQLISTDDLYYALGHNGGPIIEDGPYIYRSLFDASLDSIYVAMEKALDSYPINTDRNNLPKQQIFLTIGETGWPTKDGAFATSSFSCFYNKRIMQYAQSGIGTPRYSPKLRLDIFLGKG